MYSVHWLNFKELFLNSSAWSSTLFFFFLFSRFSEIVYLAVLVENFCIIVRGQKWSMMTPFFSPFTCQVRRASLRKVCSHVPKADVLLWLTTSTREAACCPCRPSCRLPRYFWRSFDNSFFGKCPRRTWIFIFARFFFAAESNFTFSKIGAPYSPEVPVAAMRFVPALCGGLLVPVVYHLVVEMGFSHYAAGIAALLVLCG